MKCTNVIQTGARTIIVIIAVQAFTIDNTYWNLIGWRVDS